MTSQQNESNLAHQSQVLPLDDSTVSRSMKALRIELQEIHDNIKLHSDAFESRLERSLGLFKETSNENDFICKDLGIRKEPSEHSEVDYLSRIASHFHDLGKKATKTGATCMNLSTRISIFCSNLKSDETKPSCLDEILRIDDDGPKFHDLNQTIASTISKLDAQIKEINESSHRIRSCWAPAPPAELDGRWGAVMIPPADLTLDALPRSLPNPAQVASCFESASPTGGTQTTLKTSQAAAVQSERHAMPASPDHNKLRTQARFADIIRTMRARRRILCRALIEWRLAMQRHRPHTTPGSAGVEPPRNAVAKGPHGSGWEAEREALPIRSCGELFLPVAPTERELQWIRCDETWLQVAERGRCFAELIWLFGNELNRKMKAD